MVKKILFVTHDTSRSGAPIVLLHLLRWLKQHRPNIQLDVLALHGGSLQRDFIEVSQTFYDYDTLIIDKKITFIKRVLRKLKLFKTVSEKKKLIKQLADAGYDVLYANTVVSLPIGHSIAIQNQKTRLIAHIHELNVIINQFVPNFNSYTKDIHKIIVPSQLVKDALVSNWSINTNLIEAIPECASIAQNSKKISKATNTFIVGASGFVHWRKGYDVFIQVARYIFNRHQDINMRFVWVGNFNEPTKLIIDEDIRKLGLQERVQFIGEIEQAEEIYNEFDVFILPSREDPFPLVCIEVGQLGKPIISFEQATGTNEVLLGGGGFIVPYLNIEAMAEKILIYYNKPKLKEQHGLINNREFMKFTPEIICPRLFAIIEDRV